MNQTCSMCHLSVANTNTLKYAGKTIHSTCFFCFKCKINLENKQFSEKNDKLYCLPCLIEKCAACAQPVNQSGLVALNKTWHANCFVCHRCKNDFKSNGGKFIVGEGDKPFCLNCSSSAAATNSPKSKAKSHKCKRCKQPIPENTTRIIALNNSYHQECFVCFACQIPLNPQKFCSANKKPYCPGCALQKKAVKCCSCNKLITTTVIFALKKNWHPECLCCHYCKIVLTNYGKVYRRGRYPCCPACVEAVFSSVNLNNNNSKNNNINNINNNNRNNHHDSMIIPKKRGADLIVSLETLLSDEVGIDYFIKFLVKEYAVENILFYMDIIQFRDLQNPHDIKIYSKSIYGKYIQRDSELEINIDADISQRIVAQMPTPTLTMFDEAFNCVIMLMRDHSFQNFILNSQECKELLSL